MTYLTYLLGVTALFLLPLLSSCQHRNAIEEYDYRVLIIQSYRSDCPWGDELNAGAMDMFKKNRLKADFIIYYLDSEALNEEEESAAIYSYLDDLFIPDLILVNADQALRALLHSNHPMLSKVPIVFSGVNYLEPETIAPYHDNITGFTTSPDYARTISLIQTIYPSMLSVSLDTDDSPLGRLAVEEFVEQMKSLPDEAYSITNMDITDGRSFLWNTDFSNNVIRIMPVWSSFYSGRARNSTIPFFAVNNEGLGGGFLGGYMTPAYQQTNEAARVGIALLRGEEIENYPVTASQQHPIFDWRQMKKLGLTKEQLPADAILAHQTFYEKYTTQIIWGSAVVVFIIICISSILLYLYKRAGRIKQQTQTELQGHRNRLKIVMSSLHDGLIAIDKEFNIFAINSAATQWLRLKNSESEYIGKNILSLLNITVGGEQDQLTGLLQQVFEEGKTIPFDNRYRAISLLNETGFPLSGSISAIYQEGELYGASLIINDATDEYAQKEFLDLTLIAGGLNSWRYERKSERLIFDPSFFDVVSTVEHDGDYGMTLPQFRDMIHPEDVDNWDAVNYKLIQGELEKHVFNLRINIDGKGYQWWEVRSTCLRSLDSHDVPLIFGLCSNVNDSFLTLEALEQARMKAQISDNLKSAFLANMSHEIRTPLNAIVGFANVLTSSDGFDQEERQLFIETIRNNCNLLLGLISDVLDLAQIESGSMLYNDEPCDLNELIGQIIVTQRVIIPDQLQLLGDVPEETSYLMVDRLRLNQVLTNLINNAVKFTEKGHVTVGYSRPSEHIIHFYVEDTGRGIPGKDLNNIFERFFKKDDFAQGAGLGLSICKMIVDHYHGDIKVESELGVGTRFTVTLPFVDASGNNQVVRTSNNKDNNKNLFNINEFDNMNVDDRVTLLIAEDEDSNYLLLKTVLQKYCNLIRAKTGIEALDLFKANRVDLIMLDIKMPEMTGIEALKEIRKINTEIPVIMQSAYVFDTDMEAARQAGATDFITKPINLKVLKATISKFCPSLQF